MAYFITFRQWHSKPSTKVVPVPHRCHYCGDVEEGEGGVCREKRERTHTHNIVHSSSMSCVYKT